MPNGSRLREVPRRRFYKGTDNMNGFKDYDKVELAKRLLAESGVSFILAHECRDSNVTTCASGTYATIKKCITDAMAKTIKCIHGHYREEIAVQELQEMTIVALQRLCNDKKTV